MERKLLDNIRIFWKSAELVYSTKDYTSATILYFKCLFVLLDYVLFKNLRKTPKDHTERFRLLESNFPELYKIVDKYFPIYRNTYSLSIEKDDCEEVRKNVTELIEKYKIQR